MLKEIKGYIAVALILAAWVTYYVFTFALGFVISDALDRSSLSVLASAVITGMILVAAVERDREISN
jgi:hypothetical protein